MKKNQGNNRMAALQNDCDFHSCGRGFWLCAALLILLKLWLSSFQQVYTWVGGAPLDDELMFHAAQSITAGQWLGGYDYLTLSKSMFFAVWLAFTHLLHLPYLLAGQLLWCGAALLATFAFAPVLKRNKTRLLLLAVLVFLPSSAAHYTLRVYRDNIFPALCLIFFAGFAGAALRAVQTAKNGAKGVAIWPWLVAAGAGLAAGFLTREDAGLFLLPFALAGTLIIAVVLVKKRQFARLLALVLPYAMLAAGIFTFCTINNVYYGTFALSDFSEGAFADAMGAMNRVESENGFTMLVSVPADVRQKLYDNVPELEPLAYWLEEDAQLKNDFRDPVLNDYRAGSFYWAIRRAAQQEGIYATAQTAEAYWATVAEKINLLCDEGTLPAKTGRRSGTTPPIQPQHIGPVLAESAKSAVWALTFQDCASYETLRSIGTVEDYAQWQSYLKTPLNGAAEAGKDTPYYSPAQKLAFGLLGVVRWLYALALPVAFLLALWCQFRPGTLREAWRGSPQKRVLWLLLFGFLGMAALRCGMIAFVEVASFGIGTSTMYLATVHPLLAVYAVAGIATGLPAFTTKPNKGKDIADD